MAAYYANTNAQANGDHEVHAGTCSFLPAWENRDYLGEFLSCQPAVAEARRRYPRADGCYWCSRTCHTR